MSAYLGMHILEHALILRYKNLFLINFIFKKILIKLGAQMVIHWYWEI